MAEEFVEGEIRIDVGPLERDLAKAERAMDRTADKMAASVERAAKRKEAADARAAEKARREAEIQAAAVERAAERVARAAEQAAERQARAAERAAAAQERAAEAAARRAAAQEQQAALAAERAGERKAAAAQRAADRQIREAERAARAAQKADLAYWRESTAWHNQSFSERRGRGGRGGGAALARTAFAAANIGQDFIQGGPASTINNLLQPQLYTDLAASLPAAARAFGRFVPYVVAATVALDGVGDSLHAGGLGWGDFLSVVSETQPIKGATDAIASAAKSVDDALGITSKWDAFGEHVEWVAQIAFGWGDAKDAVLQYKLEAERAANAEKAFAAHAKKYRSQAAKDKQEKSDLFGQALADAGGEKGLEGILATLKKHNSEDMSRRLIDDAIGGNRHRQDQLIGNLAANGVDVSGLRAAQAGGLGAAKDAALGVRDDYTKSKGAGGEAGAPTAARAAEFRAALQERFDRSGGKMTVEDVSAAMRAAGVDERTIASSNIATHGALSDSYNESVTSRALRDNVTPDRARQLIGEDFAREDAERARDRGDRARSEAMEAADQAAPALQGQANAGFLRMLNAGASAGEVSRAIEKQIADALRGRGLGAEQAGVAASAMAGEARSGAERTIAGDLDSAYDRGQKPRGPEVFDASDLWRRVAQGVGGNEGDRQVNIMNQQLSELKELKVILREQGARGGAIYL